VNTDEPLETITNGTVIVNVDGSDPLDAAIIPTPLLPEATNAPLTDDVGLPRVNMALLNVVSIAAL
jgi:hypothetical protein